MDIKALKAFVRTVERGSVTGAARDLAISQPAVTKHLRNLERHTSTRLFDRTPRSMRPTSQGMAFYEASRTALATLEAALEDMRSGAGIIDGTLRVFAPSCLGTHQLYEIVSQFQSDHPSVKVDYILDNRQVDIVNENFDLAVRYGRPDNQDTIVRRIGRVRRILVASPEYLSRFDPITEPEQLSTLDMILTTSIASAKDSLVLRKGGKLREIPIKPVLRTNNAQVLIRSLMSGTCVGPVQALLVSEHLASGNLVQILPNCEMEAMEAFIVYPSARFMRPVVRSFIDFLVARLAACDGID